MKNTREDTEGICSQRIIQLLGNTNNDKIFKGEPIGFWDKWKVMEGLSTHRFQVRLAGLTRFISDIANDVVDRMASSN